ncbi:MAG: hypothetical protein Q8R04_06155 [Nanoarchaeota archaeon]|nr:hypothetical protein [Nanoarchaeota archaeon]
MNIFVGTEGLTAEFAKTAPPPKVFEDSDFPILLRIKNKGAQSIAKEEKGSFASGGLLSIGREKDYVKSLSLEQEGRIIRGNTDNEVIFFVDGKTQINPKGDEIVVTLNAKTGKLDPQSEQKLSNTITATLCYPYKTVLSTTVCIDPDIAGTRPGKKVCSVKELVFGGGQGAPIAVTKIEPQMIPKGDKVIKPQFLIYIENKGQGNPVNIFDFRNVCRKDALTEQAVKNTWNVAFLKAYKSGKEGEDQNQLECTPKLEKYVPYSEADVDKVGFIRLRDKKDFVRCTFKEEIPRNSDAYTSPLRIDIYYGYVQTVSTNFLIQKPLRY